MAASKHSPPPRGLTAAFIASLRPDAERYEVPDRHAHGLRLRVYPSGLKSFVWRCTARARVITIGPWSLQEQSAHVTLDQARDWITKLKAAHRAGDGEFARVERELGENLQRRDRVADPSPADRDLLRAIAEEFYKRRILPQRKRPETARYLLDRDIIPALGDRPIAVVTTRECAAAVERVVDRDAPVHAGKVLALTKQLFRFAEARGYRIGNPAAPLDPKDLGVRGGSRSRWITAEEIPVFWKSLDVQKPARTVERPDPRTGRTQRYTQMFPALEPATVAALRILLLTAARTGELLNARWEHVDLKAATWTIPVANQKLTFEQAAKARPFVIPLAPMALGLFEQLLALADAQADDGKGSPWVMSSNAADGGHYAPQSLSRALRRLQTGGDPVLRLPGGEVSPHDLRRTARTHLGKLRVPPHVTERCLNHSLGRIVTIYDQGDYLDERREALQQWDAYIRGLLEPTAAKVIPLAAETSTRG